MCFGTEQPYCTESKLSPRRLSPPPPPQSALLRHLLTITFGREKGPLLATKQVQIPPSTQRDKSSGSSRSRSRSNRGAVIIGADSLSTRGREEVAAWQELEHQALIYKYMVSGVPVPPELLYSVKRSLESSLASRVFPHQPIGWGCFQAGFGRKADPEPGRCRRTDGKKWRCSKEAYPDSKYCERHMHRGRNRSRKPAELTSTTTATATTIPLTSINRNVSKTTVSPSSSSYSFSHLSSSGESEIFAHQNSSHNTYLNPFLYPHSSSSGPPAGSGFSPHDSTTHNQFLDSGSSPHVDKEYRYSHGMREDVDERAFFPDGLGSARGVQDSYNQLAMNSYKDYSESQFQSFADTSKEEQQQPGQRCFVLGTDIIKSSATRSIKLEKEAETQKSLHHFFGEWEPKDADSWLDLASSSRPHTADLKPNKDDDTTLVKGRAIMASPNVSQSIIIGSYVCETRDLNTHLTYVINA
ncbi:unnamed protein product [Dovyalis caffra]|uniref:Growth-regulating factor n=1 Tax=Dovyalis caffra TaxID=77055 RepID=A0AAV1SR77_9ROSI|nr:unnamed protein product [Dovyalis caffra]